MWDELLVRIMQAVLSVLLAWLGVGCTAAVPSAAIQNYPPSVATTVTTVQADDGSEASVVPPQPATNPSK